MNIERAKRAAHALLAQYEGRDNGGTDFQYWKELREALAELDKAPDNLYSWVIVNALRLSKEEWTSLIRDLLDRGASLPRAEQMTTEAGRSSLATATGLTAEEAEQIAVDARIEIDEIAWKSPPISYEKEFRNILKCRLAAAINAKQTNKP